MLSNILDRISFWSLFVVVVLLPVFFLPFTQIPIETSKGLLLVVGLVISLIFWMAARFSDGKISLPKSWLMLSGLAICLAFLVSALFATNQNISLFGTMLDTGTFYFMLAAFLLMFVSAIVLKDLKSAKTVFWGLLVSVSVLLIFQAFRLFLPDLLSLGVLGNKTDTIVGSWNSLGLLAGFMVVLSLFVIEFFSVNKRTKWLLGALIVLSLLFVTAVNYPLVWKILGIFALVVFVYKVSFSGVKKMEGQKVEFPSFSFAVVMISLLFFISGQFIGNFLPNTLGLSNVEVRPSFTTTMSVTGSVLAEDPVLGIGPNKFAEVWAKYKPQVINSTIFWDTSFNTGSGLLPTFAATTGILGILAWVFFFFLLIVSGIRALFTSIKNNTNWEIVLFFVASLYLFVSAFFYATGPTLFLLAFASTGIFIGLVSTLHPEGEYVFSFLNDPRKSFFSILLIVVLMILVAGVGFKYIERLASVSYFGKAVSAQTIPEAESAIARAVSLHQNDLYLRTYAQVYMAKINTILAKGTELSEADKADLQKSIDQAVNSAQLATTYDSTNYLNYTALASVYNSVGSLGVENANNKAIEAYNKAAELNPLNPGIKLAVARVLYSENKMKDAREYAQKALELKSDYIEALLTLSQIEKKDGNSSKAIEYAQSALNLAPENQDLNNYLNSLKGNNSTKEETPKEETKKQ